MRPTISRLLLTALAPLVASLLGAGCGGGGTDGGVPACDDGNVRSGDGCSSALKLEPGWNCTTPTGGKTACTPICGDGLLVCSEVCDDGNGKAGDGCSPACLVEPGWECHGAPSACALLPGRVRTPPSLGAPITGLPDRQWSYVEFPNTTCGDGSPAGLFISPGSQDLAIWMDAGVSCATYDLCSLKIAQGYLGPVDAPIQMNDLTKFNSTFWMGTILWRADTNNVFRDFTFIYVPFCTGDEHGGDAVVTYISGAQSLTIRHKGHANIVAYLERVAATWPNPTRLVVGGLSAGGFGTLINYDTFRLYWPSQKMYLIDDSGPVLTGLANGPYLVDAWTKWNVAAAIGDICPTCLASTWAIYPALQRWHPNDRKSLVSYLNDETIASHAYDISLGQFEAALRNTAVTTLEPNRWNWYITPGTRHTPLFEGAWGGPAVSTIRSAGISLQDYVRAQVDDEPTWCPVTPPP
jgi:cysteine-rich repeat protein